jgi:hypothetical protein
MQFLASGAWLTSLRLYLPLLSIYLWITKFHSSFSLNKIHGVFLCSSVLFFIHNNEFVLCLQLDILDIRNVVLSFWTFRHEFWNFMILSFLNCQYRNWVFKKSWRMSKYTCTMLRFRFEYLTNKGTIIFYLRFLYWV